MGKTGVANLPLHGGSAPKWLFRRMVSLSEGIVEVISLEYGKEEFLRRISDPFWFQCLSCVLGFDWHSSGTTTVTCGALKEAIKPEEHGIAIAGGKGKASRKTPMELEKTGDIFGFSTSKIEGLKYSSRMTAKVDNTAIQDGHNLYHHVFFLTEKGTWSVIQQGMNDETNYARRYHWFSKDFNDFLNDPHNAILGAQKDNEVLDMSSSESQSCQNVCLDLVNDNPIHLRSDFAFLNKPRYQTTLDNFSTHKKRQKNVIRLDMPRSINWNTMRRIYEFQPKNYEELLSMQGVGPNTVRALALISDLIYGDKPSWKDPVKFSFTVGGKDGVPFPVDRKAMDQSTDIIKQGIEQAKLGNKDKIHAIKRLKKFCNN
jgi:hypothetical protein